MVVAAVIALIIALTWPRIGLWSLLLLAATEPLERFMPERVRSRRAA